MPRQRLCILGATGSIGRATLDVAARHPDRFEITTLTACQRSAALADLCRSHTPRRAVVADAQAAAALHAALPSGHRIDISHGANALADAAASSENDTVMAAIVGAAGLPPTLAAVRAGKKVLLANKEALVLGGRFFMEAVTAAKATILPIDSEHNAIFQCLPAQATIGIAAPGVRRIVLTASGGPLRERPVATFAQVTPEEAISHPNWSMGRKISVDSATMMNKGLELIEAHWLFGLPAAQIEVVIHPQSIIHSLVDYVDGSMLAQLGNPDMRTPIAHALAFPERMISGVSPLTLIGTMSFSPPEPARFPCLTLAYQALRAGGATPAVLNAANEIAVEAFLSRQLAFDGIAKLVASCLEALPTQAATNLDDVLAVDRETRRIAHDLLPRFCG